MTPIARPRSTPWAQPLAALLLCACAAGALHAQPHRVAPTAQPPAEKEFVEKRPSASLLSQLQQGGYVLYMRHTPTDNSRADQPQPRLKLDDCSTQRLLSDAGRRLATQIGQSMRKARIPMGEVLASPMCRAQETARLAFGEFTTDKLLMYTSDLTSLQKKPITDNTRRLLSTPVPAGTNRVIVAHAPNLADLFGYFVKPEGTVVVIAPGGDGRFDYIASIHPEEWNTLLNRPHTAP